MRVIFGVILMLAPMTATSGVIGKTNVNMDGEKVFVTVSSIDNLTPAASVGYLGRYETVAKGRFTCMSIARNLRRSPDEALEAVESHCNNGLSFWTSKEFNKKSAFNEILTVQTRGENYSSPAKKGSFPYWLHETIIKDIKARMPKEQAAKK